MDISGNFVNPVGCRLTVWALLCLLLLPGFIHAQAEGQSRRQWLDQQFLRDLQTLTQPETRTIGSEGYYQTGDYLQEQINAIEGVELQVHEYTVMMPVMRKPATVTIDGGATERIYPFWPAH